MYGGNEICIQDIGRKTSMKEITCKDNVKIDTKNTVCEYVIWIQLGQDKV
jgi:hypothetical protein